METSIPSVKEAIAALEAGEVVALPTETVYGLACDAQNPSALAKLYDLKGRPANVPLPVALAEASWAEGWQREPQPAVERLATRWWPGPLTIVVDAHDAVSTVVTAGLGTVALRVPAQPLALSVIQGLGRAVALTSANRHGEPPAQSAESVAEVFGAEVPVVVDGGPSTLGVPTTIVALGADSSWRVLREGSVTAHELQSVLGVSPRS